MAQSRRTRTLTQLAVVCFLCSAYISAQAQSPPANDRIESILSKMSLEDAVKQAHVGAIMDSYNLINGAHATQNGYFNADIVRDQWVLRAS